MCHWYVLATFHRDVVGVLIWDVPATSLGRAERRRYDVVTTSSCRVGKFLENYFGQKEEQTFWQFSFVYLSKVLQNFICARVIGSIWSIRFGNDNLIDVSVCEDIPIYFVSWFSGGPCNTEKYCRPPWLADKKTFWILDALEWLKQ